MMKKIAAGTWLMLACLCAATSGAGNEPSERDLSCFLRRLRTVSHLPELEASHTAMASTWDRSGGNFDGTDFKNIVKPTAESSGRNILLDAAGPGCIHRIFTGMLNDQLTGTRIQIFLDHHPKPVFDMPVLEFFSDSEGPIPYPLVFYKSYPGTLFPIPFEKHCLVQLVNERFGQPDWKDEAWGNYWQVTYTRYPDSVKVKSLVWPPSEAEKKEIAATAQAWLEAESQPPAEPDRWAIDRTAAVEPAGALTVDLSGAGVIRQVRIAVEPATPEILRGARLRIKWDKAAAASVDVPIGHFFGHAYSGHGRWFTSKAVVLGRKPLKDSPYVDYPSAYNSLLLGVTDQEAYSRFPMPFSNGASLVIENRSGQTIEKLRVRLDVEPRERIPANWGRFHATFNEAPAATGETPGFGPQKVPGQVVLQRQGRGKYVGVMLSVDWPYENAYWWGEGDWLIWTDEDAWPPSYHGTGSEEYFNSGWGQFDRKAVSGFVTERPGHPTVYSFHLNDAFQFQRSIRVVEEQMGAWVADKVIRERHPLWTSTAYWYADSAQPAGSAAAQVDVREPAGPAAARAARPRGGTKPTLADVAYGPHPRQVLDFYKADSSTPTPLVFHIHGGGWVFGDKAPLVVDTFLKAGISVVSINYRLVPQAQAAGVKPPVKWPLEDAARALQFVRSKAGEWNVDKARIGATGGSAGACSSLWLAFHDDMAVPASTDPVARESTRLWCAAVNGAQTTLDPKQMKEWTPNSKYGGHAFGFQDDPASGVSQFERFLAGREGILPWIKEYSPYELASADDPPVYLYYNAPPALGQEQKDPTHTANFGVKLREKLDKLGVPCQLVYPGAPDVQYQTANECLIARLKADDMGSDDAPEAKQTFTVYPIGQVQKADGRTLIVLDKKYQPGLLGLGQKGFSHVHVIWWFDKNDTPEKRSILQVHPRGDQKNPITGVFACRSPFRPNLIALSLAKVVSVKDNVLEIDQIDAFDGTPVLDLKPYAPGLDTAKDVKVPDWAGLR